MWQPWFVACMDSYLSQWKFQLMFHLHILEALACSMFHSYLYRVQETYLQKEQECSQLHQWHDSCYRLLTTRNIESLFYVLSHVYWRRFLNLCFLSDVNLGRISHPSLVLLIHFNKYLFLIKINKQINHNWNISSVRLNASNKCIKLAYDKHCLIWRNLI